ncbi:hypothetical protein PCANC_26766 [Puccinia coronata f. sp. avenae]|uniref:Uncharacterized protein n=1 Tax=Puccinia coronata f. sp. avenae TaxID=200324 RepID=A0A2N5RXS6_9BASI|nr:hypothetical protein PCANC_26766 [Puccinia coronata f. sp. avenae]
MIDGIKLNIKYGKTCILLSISRDILGLAKWLATARCSQVLEWEPPHRVPARYSGWEPELNQLPLGGPPARVSTAGCRTRAVNRFFKHRDSAIELDTSPWGLLRCVTLPLAPPSPW